jgi:lipoprotein-releasing system ATP-binding protein
MIKINNINKSFDKLNVLKDINSNIEKGEIVSVTGSSGAGKTTLLQIIGTLLEADKGSIRINNTDITKLNQKELAKFRNEHIGFVFQFHHLLPEFTALENICMPAFIKGTNKKEAVKYAEKLLDFLNLSNRALHKPNEMSGGEQQRVAVARALINNPSVILADEPSGNLDSENKKALHKLFFSLRDKFEQTFVIVTHNNELAQMSDRIIKLKDGKILDETV